VSTTETNVVENGSQKIPNYTDLDFSNSTVFITNIKTTLASIIDNSTLAINESTEKTTLNIKINETEPTQEPNFYSTLDLRPTSYLDKPTETHSFSDIINTDISTVYSTSTEKISKESTNIEYFSNTPSTTIASAYSESVINNSSSEQYKTSISLETSFTTIEVPTMSSSNDTSSLFYRYNE